MTAQVCFAQGVIDGPLFSQLVTRHDLGFEPHELSCNGRSMRYGAAALRLLGEARDVWSARVTGAEEQMVALGGIASRPVDQVIWTAPTLPADFGLLEELTRLPGFHAAYLSDADDVRWQSETSIEAFEAAGRDHSAVPKIGGGFFPGEEEEIDISGNPGRAVPLDGLWLHAASTMWFGPGAFKLLDRDRLFSLPEGRVDEREAGIVRVELFPFDWYANSTAEVRQRQQLFRDHLAFDELEARADEIEAATADPTYEFDTGDFPHGGVRRITEWLDESGLRAVPRSRARRRRTAELSETGAVIWRDEVEA